MISLYVKTHNKTGLKYFGKTKQNPITYKGSGKYWKQHIRKHGYDVTTKIIGIFCSEQDCEKVAVNYSKENNIVNSIEWANLKEENGKDGSPIGVRHSTEHKEKISRSLHGKCYNDFDADTRKRMSDAAKKRADQKVKDGSHQFLGESGKEISRNRNKKLVDSQQHNFLGKGKIWVIDIKGMVSRITKQEFDAQCKSCVPYYVSVNSEEGKLRSWKYDSI